MRPTGSAAARGTSTTAPSTYPTVLLTRSSKGGSHPNFGAPDPAQGGGASGPGRSPVLFAILVFGVPLALIILVEILRS